MKIKDKLNRLSRRSILVVQTKEEEIRIEKSNGCIFDVEVCCDDEYTQYHATKGMLISNALSWVPVVKTKILKY